MFKTAILLGLLAVAASDDPLIQFVRAWDADARAVREFTWQPRLPYRASTAAGPGWAMLPSAAAFIDPLFSTGIPLTLLGIERLGRILAESFGQPELERRLDDYGETLLAEADHTAHFIGSCYASFRQFERFTAYSMFYFAAASYSEMARRFDRGRLVARFLAADRSDFAPAMRELGERVRQDCDADDPSAFAARVAGAIHCLNIAGLCVPAKKNWYGVELDDVVAGAPKLGLTSEEALTALRRLRLISGLDHC